MDESLREGEGEREERGVEGWGREGVEGGKRRNIQRRGGLKVEG